MGFNLHFYPTVPLVIILLCLLYALSLAKWHTRSHGRPFPPGPPSLPVVGNLFNTPGDKPWSAFNDLAAQYGEIIHFRMLSQSTIVLGSPEVIDEYLEKRASSTSDRPQTPMIDLLGQRDNFGLMPYGQRWRRYRCHFWQHFTSRAVQQYQPITRAVAHQFLARLVDRPSQFKSHVRYTFLAMVLKVVYGISLTEHNDKYTAAFEVSAEGISQGLVPGGYKIVETFPFLKELPKWVPRFGFLADLDRWRAAINEVKEVPFAHAREAMARGEGFDSIVAKMLTVAENTNWPEETHEEMVKGLGFTSYEAGADTSFIALQAFFLAMSLHPDVQRKAQAELDAIVRQGCMPEFSDSDSLVYVNAVMKETLRWADGTPSPHSDWPTQQLLMTSCAGTSFPPGLSYWQTYGEACMHDPAVYQDPHVFRPECFLRDGTPDPSGLDPIPFVFGFGRRICPGRHFALASLFMNIASVLHGFNITPPLDENGRPITVYHSQSTGLASYPEDCRVTIKPRSADISKSEKISRRILL